MILFKSTFQPSRLNDYVIINAQVLNSARKAIPTEPLIWITATQLEEQQGNVHTIENIIDNAVKTLRVQGVVISRAEWLKMAMQVEKGGHPLTCGAIVRTTIGLGVEDEDRKRTWIADAETAAKTGKQP